MAPLTTQADAIDAIRSAVTSVSTCTPAISASLKELLQGRPDSRDESSKPSLKSTRKPAQSSARIKSSTATTKKPAKGTGETCHSSSDMSPKEKAVLATQIINATLKALGDAAKTPSQVSNSARSPAKNDAAKPALRTRPRRSASVPMTPLQPRALNRVDTTPATTKPSATLPSTPPTGCLALVECARVAFITLRSLQASGAITLPDLQLESGMSSLVAKLIALKLFDHAAKELRVLKARLERIAAGNGKMKTGVPTKSTSTAPKTLSDLLDYPAGQYSGPVLSFVITAQLQALRILYELNKTTHLAAVLPFLRPINPTSPLALLSSCAQDKKAESLKIAKQLGSLSQVLLSLTPSLASKDDDVALEPRLSPSPETSLEVQTLGLITRLESWSVSGHKGDMDKEILLPLSRCLAAFSRRSSVEHNSKLVGAFTQVWEKIGLLGLHVPTTSKGSLAPIYQLLAKAFQEAGNSKEAKKWTSKWRGLIKPDEDSAAKCCAVAAQLLALSLQDSSAIDEGLAAQVLDEMQGPLSGSVTELEDLLISLCFLRKVAFNMVIKESTGNTEQEPENRQELCEKFIAQLPRFALRWLGKPPGPNSMTKDLLRFEQRRQLLSKHLRQILESALLLTKTQLDEDRFVWEAIDSMLQDILVLLEYMGDFGQSSRSSPAASYHVKISHIYYQLHLTLRKSTIEGTKSTSLRVLKRSIDCVRQQSEPEQARAQLLKKWEAFVELCKASNRRDDAIDALRSIRDHLARCDTVQAITTSLACQSVKQSWRINAETELLSRTICNLAKLERRPNDWTWLLTAQDKPTALEHDLHFILTNVNQMHHKVDISNPIIATLLQLYSVEQYPIRRLRSLLILLTVSIDSREQVEELRAEIELALKKIKDKCLGHDTGLVRYAPYLCQSALCILSIACGEFNSPEIQQAISAWKSMAAGCQSVNQLAEHIDDPQHLLQILQSLADLARMRGLQSLLTETVELSTIISQLTIDDNVESHIVQSASLSLHYLALGQSTKAEKILQALMATDMVALPQISSDIVSDFHLLTAEYYLAVGKFDHAERHLEDARKAAVNSTSQTRRSKTQVNRKISMAHASYLASSLYLERGENHRALKLAKTAVKVLFYDWSQLEQCRNSSPNFATGDLSQTDSSEEDACPDNSRMSDLDVARAHTGPVFWNLAYPLYRFTLQLSLTYEHLGMYQETLYYAEKAQDIARSMGSSSYLAQATTHVASVSLMADKIEKSLELVTETKLALISSEPTCQAVAALCKAASVYQQAEEAGNEAELLTNAESMLHDLQKKISLGEDIAGGNLEAEPMRNPVKRTAPPRYRGRGPNAAKPIAAPRKTAAKKTTAKGPNALAKIAIQVREEDNQLKSLRASVLLSRSLSFIKQQDWVAAITSLRSAAELSILSSDLSQEHFLLGISLMGQSLTQMGSHAIFSFIQDSTLSFPSVALTVGDKSPHGQLLAGRASPHKSRSTQQDTQGFVDNLQEAQEHLLEAHSIATRNGDGFLVHRIAAALQNVVVLLSNTSSSAVRASHPAYATCSIELARNLTWRRERKANRCDTVNDKTGAWPMVIDSPNPGRASLGFSADMSQFQRDYLDIIPSTWNVVSLSLNETKNDLCVTKLKAGSSPFALRLPLDRACSRDTNNEVFDFPQGRSELVELIEQINRTCHSAQDMNQKGAKSEWWAEREELDQRLKDLLETIESTWLGGFKGIFSQHRKRSDLARFQKSFLVILEKHLPSRHQVRGRKTKKPTTKVNLDPRILELFIGLGDPRTSEIDLDEPLMDLLYFVVDVLQFHGEANAYDEIEFDAMVVDISSALHAYHVAAKEAKTDRKGTHTILILDKSLHVFPWESLPCLQGLAVSRVPSLDYLRRSILEAKAWTSHHDDAESDSDGSSNSATTSRTGHHVSINSGTYILNPSTDLTTTQATFGRALSSLPAAWGSIESRAPTETEFETALTEKDIMLYFGHGSGSQYIRGRTIRQLEKCRAVALLMGCSSASLTHVGQFEPYGPIRDYMLAGSPAVVGTLWDVTDRDIDRFAGAVFEEWGLFPRGTFPGDGKAARRGGKGKAPAATAAAAQGKHGSLVEAVAKARTEACRFKYITAAAVCVYGIPVYIGK
ncbi:peptidase family C50-domain-containing protein [Nemania serpens]|nr:peptidase family C50-domain-containing protein [Nemania serpens]